MGRLIEAKGLFEALEAVAGWLVRGNRPEIEFRIAGSGPAEAALRARVDTLGLGSRVSFLGEVHGAAKEAFWRYAQLLLFPTWHREKLPNALLESLVSATPVVTCAVGGICDVVSDGVHGRIVPPRDRGVLLDCLESLIGDPDRYRSMWQACRERATVFGVEGLVLRLDALYAGQFGQRPRVSPA